MWKNQLHSFIISPHTLNIAFANHNHRCHCSSYFTWGLRAPPDLNVWAALHPTVQKQGTSDPWSSPWLCESHEVSLCPPDSADLHHSPAGFPGDLVYPPDPPGRSCYWSWRTTCAGRSRTPRTSCWCRHTPPWTWRLRPRPGETLEIFLPSPPNSVVRRWPFRRQTRQPSRGSVPGCLARGWGPGRGCGRWRQCFS